MSTEIQPAKLPGNITASTSQKNVKSSSQGQTIDRGQAAQPPAATADTVSITDTVARLQKIETELAAMPAVNDKLVSEIKQLMSDGSLEMDLDRIAKSLLEIETGVVTNNKG